ncbi:hypothetical protein ISE1_4240 [plant metagenome]|uniref:Uncharacterized protein n=1 Tax=plant metagenome TaxID=1297885 RepID=A0A484U5H8_9ZZZZ
MFPRLFQGTTAVPRPPLRSRLADSAWSRLLAAVCVSAALWGLIAWAMGGAGL